MDAQSFIREIARVREGACGLTYPAALRMFDALFGGGLADVEVGAILAGLRIRGESLEEVRAGLDVLEPLLLRVPVDASRPVVSIPSYAGARDTANLVPLLACLLADAGVQVVIHGVTGDPDRTTSAEILQAMGLGPVNGMEQAQAALARHDPAFLPVRTLSPRLAALLDLRRVLGLSNVGHTLVHLINPTDSPVCLRIASFTRPEAHRLQHAYFGSAGIPALLLRATEGEPVASTRRGGQIDWLHEGLCDVLVPAQAGPLRDLPALPDPHDAPATARWIQSVLAGERPVPDPIEQQVAAVLQAVGLKPLAHSAVPA